MTKILKLSLLSLAALCAGSGAVAAQDIRIPVAGKSPRAIHIEIVKAAYRVCDEAALNFMSSAPADQCVAAAVADATQQLRQVQPVQSARIVPANSGR
jgi:hypothetical protein